MSSWIGGRRRVPSWLARAVKHLLGVRLKHVPCVVAALLIAAVRSTTCGAQSRVVTDSVSSPGLRGNVVGDSPTRKVLVYLPPSYGRETARRYPVLYLL